MTIVISLPLTSILFKGASPCGVLTLAAYLPPSLATISKIVRFPCGESIVISHEPARLLCANSEAEPISKAASRQLAVNNLFIISPLNFDFVYYRDVDCRLTIYRKRQ